ncbi:MAG: HEAT repeat domain-containing protein [Planctomycetes bacterium]|nr:HEAT repeat domain-containing protein [Planctomycetota bacterium]
MIAVATILALALAQTPEELVRQLGHEEASRREEAASALETLGERAVPALEQGAKSVDPEVRERAAEVLSTVRMTLMVGRKLDPDRLAQVRAAIDNWRTRVQGVVEVPEPTAYDDLIEHPEGERRPADLADIPYLLGILWDPGPVDGEVGGLPRAQYLRWRALQAVRHFPITDENEERLIAILRAVLPAGDRPATEAEDRYWGAMFSDAAQVSQPAVREAIRERTLAALSVLAKSSQGETRARVARALAAWDDAEIVPVLARLLEDADPDVQNWAVACMEDRDPAPFKGALARIVATTDREWIRYNAARALARCGEKAGVDALFGLATGTEGGLWREAFQSIQGLIAAPEGLANQNERVLEVWQAWWTEHRASARWDTDQERFVTE